MTFAIQVNQLVKQYPKLTALNQVNFEVKQGEFFGLLGPNGAGKTTLISILAGLARATSGTAQVMGFDVQKDYQQARRTLGVVPQELSFDPFFTARETLQWQSGYFGIKNNRVWIDELLEHLGLTDKADVNMRALSGGMKRRVLVAQALVHRPKVIILDEPTAGVDVELRQTLWKFIAQLNQQGSTVLLTTHYLEEAEALCGRVAMLKSGNIVALDRTSDLLKAASGNVLRFKIHSTSSNTAALPDTISKKARVTGNVVQLPVQNALEIEQHLAAARQAGLVVEDVEMRKADLEDVFLDIMQKGAA